jgi:hypothetical protein
MTLVCVGLLSVAEVPLQSNRIIHLRLSDSMYATFQSNGHPKLMTVFFYKTRTHVQVAKPKGVFVDGPFGRSEKPFEGIFAIGLVGKYTVGIKGGQSYLLSSALKVFAPS